MSVLGESEIPNNTVAPEPEEGQISAAVTDDKSDGEISEGELSDEGEISDDGELPESEPEPDKEIETPTENSQSEKSPDRFDRFEVWKDAMVNNMRSAFNKVGGPEAMASSSGSSESESDENSAMYMNDSEIPPNLQSFTGMANANLLGALGVTDEGTPGDDNGVKRKKKKKKKGAPSEWWERHKEIYEKMKERRLEMDAQRAKTHCKFFQKGFCKEGDTCPFLHEVLRKLDVCKYFIKNLDCHKGENCPYMHNDYPCKYYHLRGFCYNDKECRFSHAELTDDTKQVIEDLRNSRFKRGRHHSTEECGYDRDYDQKALFTDPDAAHPNKKVLLPTPGRHSDDRDDRHHDRRHHDRHHDRHRRGDRSGRPYRGSARGGFRGRNRGFYNNRGRGGFENRGGRGYHNNFNNNFNDFNNFNDGPPPVHNNFNNASQDIPAFNPDPIPMDGMLPPPAIFPASDFTDNRPPPPPPPAHPNPASAIADFSTKLTAEPIGLIMPESTVSKATVCPSRDPRLKSASEKEKLYPTLADMFKSLDPTASPFG